jgi:hypothetical protein
MAPEVRSGLLEAAGAVPGQGCKPWPLLCHFPPAIPCRGDGPGRNTTAAGRRGPVGGLSGYDRRDKARSPGRLGAGLLYWSAAARRAQEHRADGGKARPGAGTGRPQVAAPRGGAGGMGRCAGAGAGATDDRAAWAGASRIFNDTSLPRQAKHSVGVTSATWLRPDEWRKHRRSFLAWHRARYPSIVPAI